MTTPATLREPTTVTMEGKEERMIIYKKATFPASHRDLRFVTDPACPLNYELTRLGEAWADLKVSFLDAYGINLRWW